MYSYPSRVNLIFFSFLNLFLYAVNDILFSRAADAMASYKQTVANTYFDEPVGEAQPNETDNGTD